MFINSSLSTVLIIFLGLIYGRHIKSIDPLLFPLTGLFVPALINYILPPVINLTSSTVSNAELNHLTEVSDGINITTGCNCFLHCSAALLIQG